MKILIIDDDPQILETVAMCFSVGWPDAQIIPAPNGKRGLDLLEQESPDIVILDIGLPDMDGIEVCGMLRQRSEVPILMLTARTQEADIVRCLEKGADDYIKKPFGYLELIARIKTVLRRCQSVVPSTSEPDLVVGDIVMDYSNRQVRRGGQVLKLTPTEYQILYHLTKNIGKVLTSQTLLAKVWGREYIDEKDYLKVHIQHLRQKLGDDVQTPKLIVNERGIGYKFAAPAE